MIAGLTCRVLPAITVPWATITSRTTDAPTATVPSSPPLPSVQTRASVPALQVLVGSHVTTVSLDTMIYRPTAVLPATALQLELVAPPMIVAQPPDSVPVLETQSEETVQIAPRDTTRQTAQIQLCVWSVCVQTGVTVVRTARLTTWLLPGYLTSSSCAVRTLWTVLMAGNYSHPVPSIPIDLGQGQFNSPFVHT